MTTTRTNGDPNRGAERDDEDVALRETEAEIAATRERLAASLGALREEITTLTDWREWVRRRPAPFVLGAFALGFLAGWRAAVD
jgi:hypothetical protein